MRNSDGTFLQVTRQSQWSPYELQRLDRTHTLAALATLVEIMSNTASPPNARVSAAVALLDRGYSRPTTAVFVEMTSQVSSADRAHATDLGEDRERGMLMNVRHWCRRILAGCARLADFGCGILCV
jgi:hypothetical protein